MEDDNKMNTFEVSICVILTVNLIIFLIRNYYYFILWNSIYKKGLSSELNYLFPAGMKKFMLEIDIKTNEIENEYVEIIKKINLFSLLFQFGMFSGVMWGIFGSIFI